MTFFTHNLPLYMSSTRVEKYLCGYQQPTDLLSVTVYNIKTAISETTERFTFSFITRQTQVPHTDHVGTALWQYVQRWGLGMRTRATSTWSEIGRSALCGHVDSCSSAFIASVAWKQPRFEWCIGPKAQEKECSVCCIQKKGRRIWIGNAWWSHGFIVTRNLAVKKKIVTKFQCSVCANF